MEADTWRNEKRYFWFTSFFVFEGKVSKKVECNLGGYFLVWEGSHKVHEGICREEVNGSADPEYWKA